MAAIAAAFFKKERTPCAQYKGHLSIQSGLTIKVYKIFATLYLSPT